MFDRSENESNLLTVLFVLSGFGKSPRLLLPMKELGRPSVCFYEPPMHLYIVTIFVQANRSNGPPALASLSFYGPNVHSQVKSPDFTGSALLTN